MQKAIHSVAVAATVAAVVLAVGPQCVEAQGRGNASRNTVQASVEVSLDAGITLSTGVKTEIREYYASREPSGAEALPPGIRRNLERGRPLPPGIAKRMAPPDLTSRIEVHDGYELVEVGLDVFLVEVATNVIHDVLMDVIR